MEIPQIRVQILIPVHNGVDLIDETVDSIKRQSFNQDNIYLVIVDFDSDDGTYEKILQYDSFHLGIYQYRGNFTKGTMAAQTIKYSQSTNPGGEYSYKMLLWPGDVLYPEFLTKMVELMYSNRTYNPLMVIGEVDVKGAGDGQIRHNPPLFQECGVIHGKDRYEEFWTRGYNQNIICFAGPFPAGKHRESGRKNEKIWWNKNIDAGNFERNFIYVPERYACIRERFYDDELREILLRWESLLLFVRGYEAKFRKKMIGDFVEKTELNLCNYAIWRSFLLYGRGNREQAVTCLKISCVIQPEFENTKIYRLMKELVMEDKKQDIRQIEDYFTGN